MITSFAVPTSIRTGRLALCASCAAELRQPGNGRPRRFCSAACRKAAFRRRAQALPEATPLTPRGGRLSLRRRVEGSANA